MTDEQKADILGYYNAARKNEDAALERMDEAAKAESAAQDEKHLRRALNRWAKASSDHSFALGTMYGITAALEAIGYCLRVDDCEEVVGIF